MTASYNSTRSGSISNSRESAGYKPRGSDSRSGSASSTPIERPPLTRIRSRRVKIVSKEGRLTLVEV